MRLSWAIVLVLAVAGSVGVAQEQEEGFVPLFNGEDLTGWVVMGSKCWEAQENEVVCTGKGGGWLRSAEEYEDFVWRFEYSISPGGNSGAFIRATEGGNAAFTGMELQILDDHGKPPNKHTAMALYAAVAPSKNMSKPAGEFNEVEISCIGVDLKVTFNGEVVVECKLDDPNIDTGEHAKLMDRAKTGYIGMQSHGNPVKFRKLRIKRLK